MASDRTMRMRLATGVQWAGLLVAAVIAVVPLVPPAPPELQPPSTEFSSERAMVHLEAIAREPHPMGSPEIAAARDEIIARLDALGLEPETQRLTAPDYYGSGGGAVDVVNVMARIPGTASTGAVLLMGHYDTFPATPGANDNSSAVAVLLETARSVREGDPLRNDLILLFTDGEEPAPRYGSTAFVSRHPWADEVEFVINLEAVGGSGSSLLLETAGPQAWIMEHYRAVSHPAAFSFLTDTTELIGGSNTDFAPFRDAGITGVELAYVRGSPIYHTPSDDIDSVSLASLQHHGASTLAIVRQVGSDDLAAANGDADVVFFPLARGLVVYPAWWSLPALALTGVVLAGAIRGRWRPPFRDAAVALATALAGALVATLAWLVLAGVRESMGVKESYLYLALLVALAQKTSTTLQQWQAGPRDEAGPVTLWWLLALVPAVVVPGIGAVFLWPALIGALVLTWLASAPNPWARALGSMLAGGVALVMAIPAIDVFFQFAQPRPGNPDSQILFIVLVPILLAVLLVDLVLSFVATPRPSADAACPPTSGRSDGLLSRSSSDRRPNQAHR